MSDPLRDAAEVARRREMLAAPAWAGFRALTEGLRAAGHAVADPDPLDGGLAARLLVVLERPGRGVAGARMVSRDNATPTARNLRRFLAAAGIGRQETLIWNVVPWLEAGAARDRAPSRTEVGEGVVWLGRLLALMSRLAVVVLAGRTAAAAVAAVRRAKPGAMVLRMPHPSPTILCTSPVFGARIEACLGEAASSLRESGR